MPSTYTDNGNLQSRSLQIDRVIEKRQPLANRIETVENNLKAVSNLLQEVEETRDSLLNLIDDSTLTNRLLFGC